MSVLSQSQDGAGDDGALDLVGAAVDGGLAQVQVGRGADAGPGGGVGVLPSAGGEGVRPGQVHQQLAGSLLQLSAAELEHRRRRVGLAVGGVGDHAQRGQLQGQQVVLQLGDAGSGAWVLNHRGAVDADLGRVLLGLGDEALCGAHRGDADALVAEQELGVIPALVLLADEVLGGDADVGEEDLVDLVAAVDQLDWAQADPGVSMGTTRKEMPR